MMIFEIKNIKQIDGTSVVSTVMVKVKRNQLVTGHGSEVTVIVL